MYTNNEHIKIAQSEASCEKHNQPGFYAILDPHDMRNKKSLYISNVSFIYSRPSRHVSKCIPKI